MERPKQVLRHPIEVLLATPLCLADCSTLPEDGPSARRVSANAKPDKKPSYALVDIDYRVTQVISAEAAMKPITNLGKRHQICAASGF